MAVLRIVVLAAAFASAACAGRDARGPFRGQVIDAETGQPLQSAIVLATWHYESSLAHPRTAQFDAQETVTDVNGSWEIPALPLRATIFKLGVRPQFWVFMPGGYDIAGVRQTPNRQTAASMTVLLMRRLGTQDERCRVLSRPTALSLEPREKMPRFLAARERERLILKCGSPG